MKFCPECGTKVEGMKFCPECGYRIVANDTKLVCPEFPEDMSLGKRDTVSSVGIYTKNKDDATILKNTSYTIECHENGIAIVEWFKATLEIHYTQIISITQYDEQDIKDKSVVGRGIVGLAIGGPLGAVLGGMSGVGQKTKNKYYLLIEYWDCETREPVAISFESKKPFTKLLNYCRKKF